MDNYEIVTKEGMMRLYEEWFGRPYDNFHKINHATYDNDCLSVYFESKEVLIIYHPIGIANQEHCFEVKQTAKVIWIYTPYGKDHAIQYGYEYCENGTVLKTTLGIETCFVPDVTIAVQCVSLGIIKSFVSFDETICYRFLIIDGLGIHLGWKGLI